MRQFVHCNGCNRQVPTPESLDGKPSPQFLKCETCGNEFFWNGGLTDNSEPLILFSIEDPTENFDATDVLAIESNEDSNGFVSDGNEIDHTGSDCTSENTYISNSVPEIIDGTALVFPSEQTGLDNPESVEKQFEEFARDTLPSLEPEPFPLTQFAPSEVEEVQDPPAFDTEPEPFELELEIESEGDTQASESEASHSPATEVATDHEESIPAIEPYYATDLYEADQPAQAQAIAKTPAVELAAPLESSLAVDWSVLGPAIPRRRPKEVSAIRKILPPVLGGLAAFPIATLILWYGFGKDIGTTGPTVAKYVPWIVPEKFRSIPLENSPPNFASGRTQRSAPSTRNTLPTLNRDETTVPPNEDFNASASTIATEKPKVAPEKQTTPAESKANSENESFTSNISQTMEAIKDLQKEMENTPPKDTKGKARIFIACQSKLKVLSKQASELTGPSANIWKKQIETISRKVLADSDIPRVMGIIANEARKEFKAFVSGDFVATVLEIAEADSPLPNATWKVREKWRSDDGGIPIEVLPGAWPTSSTSLPAICMAFGRLLPNEDSDANSRDSGSTGTGLVLKVHLLVPK